MIKKFEDLEVWKKAMNLTLEAYKSTKLIRDLILKQQIHRSLISIPSTIAERFDRQTNKEFIQFLYISKGLCSELRTQLYLLNELGLLEDFVLNQFIEKTKKISDMLYNLINTKKINSGCTGFRSSFSDIQFPIRLRG